MIWRPFKIEFEFAYSRVLSTTSSVSESLLCLRITWSAFAGHKSNFLHRSGQSLIADFAGRISHEEFDNCSKVEEVHSLGQPSHLHLVRKSPRPHTRQAQTNHQVRHFTGRREIRENQFFILRFGHHARADCDLRRHRSNNCSGIPQ